MAEGFVEVAPDSTGKKVRTEELTVGANTVEQQVVSLATSTGTLLDDPSRSSVTQPISGTVAVSALPATPAGTNVIGHVIADTGSTTAVTSLPAITGTVTANDVPPTLTKGTQGTTGFTVQDLKDSGRKYIIITLDALAGITTEALATMSINAGGTVTAATTYTVTAGKTLRLQFFGTSAKNTSTAATDSRMRVRTAASVLATSPIIIANECGTPAAVANVGATDETPIPDGIEIAGGQQIGISHIESATTSTVSGNLIGYEY